MAIPIPFPGLSALLGAYGKVFKSRESYPLLPDDRPTITVMIPALNEERTLPYALTSLAVQTITPDCVIIVDDGSTDDTVRIVEELSNELDLRIELRQHDEPMGKTVGVKEVARSVETETLFVLDADTFLESKDYLEKLLAPHAESHVASSFGTVYPIDGRSKQTFYDRHVASLLRADGVTHSHLRSDLESATSRTGPLEYLTSRKPLVQFRNLNYHVEQRFFSDGFMRMFGSTLFPVGCGVLYDRAKLVSVFDAYEGSHGDDLTNSEDIFVGFAFCDRGWANVRIADTYMRSSIPNFRGVLKQTYLWGSGFLQSAYYFKRLTGRYRKRRIATDGATETTQESMTRNDATIVKQPMGRIVTARIIDGLYPTTVLLLIALSLFGIVDAVIPGFLILWEFSLYVFLGLLTLSDRVRMRRDLVPFLVIRFFTLPVLTYTYLRVGTDIVTRNRNWRK